jgi:hypothetical protein
MLAAAGIGMVVLLTLTPGSALAAESKYWDGNTTRNQMKYSPDLVSVIGGRGYSPGQGLGEDIFTLDIGGSVEFSASGSAGAVTLSHPRVYNSFSGCRWTSPVNTPGSGRMQCWIRS